MGSDTKPHQATVEDCSSDDDVGNGVCNEDVTPDTFPGKANVCTKRSNPEDMGTDKTPMGRVPNNFDGKSDSGYSSQSVAGMSSADSAASALSSQRSPPAMPAMPANTAPAAPPPAPAQRAPRPPHQRQQSTQSTQSTQSAARQLLSRRDSQASRRPPAERRPTITQSVPKRKDSRNDECTVPGCTECGPDAVNPQRRRRQSMLQTQPAESAPDVSYPRPYDTRSQVSDPAQYYPSPTNSRQPRSYHPQGGPVIQPGISRRLSVNSRSARPTSYHGDPRDGYGWAQLGMHPTHPSPPQEHGPSLSRPAYNNGPFPQQHPMAPSYGVPQYVSHNPYFDQARQMQPSYDQRPTISARGPNPSAYAPHVPPAVVQVERQGRPMLSARYHSTPAVHQAPPLRRPPHVGHYNEEDEGSQSDSESDYDSEDEYVDEGRSQRTRKLMGPPETRPARDASQRRPKLPHANTTPAPPARRHAHPQTVVVPLPQNRGLNKDPRKAPRKSVSRPPVVKSDSAYDTPQARIYVEGSRSFRRDSQVYNKTINEPRRERQQEYPQEPRRTNRSPRMYNDGIVGRDYEREFDDDDDTEEDERVTRLPLRRRGTDVESHRRPQRLVEEKNKADAAEQYMNNTRGDHNTLADRSYKIAGKRSSRISGGPSEAESSRSKGSDKQNGEIRLRIRNDAPITLNLNEDMEGRTLQLVPIDNGTNELVISKARGNESTYHSERGSVRGDMRALVSTNQARRDAEEILERGSLHSRRRRDTRGGAREELRKPLQGRSRTEYY